LAPLGTAVWNNVRRTMSLSGLELSNWIVGSGTAGLGLEEEEVEMGVQTMLDIQSI